MSRRDGRKQRYLVLPGRGISGAAMQADVFEGREAGGRARLLTQRLDSLSHFAMASDAMPAAPAAAAELAAELAPDDFRVISQRFADGPATVAMTHAARLALEAANPGLRVLPITRYTLPGDRPRRAKDAQAAARPAAETAVESNGSVFLGDMKQHFAATLVGGAEGKGVIVGVVDTGVDKTHPALEKPVVGLRCFIDGDPPTAGGPVNWGAAEAHRAGHGTHVAGIIAAAPGHGGPAGLAPAAKLISYRIFPNDPHGRRPAENPVIIDSVRAAIDDGCQIVNLSIEGATLKEDGVRSAIAEAWDNGVLCIAAAGNGGGYPVSFPAALPHCVAVTAVGREGNFPPRPSFTKHVSDQRATSDPAIYLAKFSNFGPPVQFTAPGHAIVSTFPGGQWWFNSGTSMAAPFVTGLLARLLSDNGNVLAMPGTAERSAVMLQMLVGRARVLGLPQAMQEGYGLPS